MSSSESKSDNDPDATGGREESPDIQMVQRGRVGGRRGGRRRRRSLINRQIIGPDERERRLSQTEHAPFRWSNGDLPTRAMVGLPIVGTEVTGTPFQQIWSQRAARFHHKDERLTAAQYEDYLESANSRMALCAGNVPMVQYVRLPELMAHITEPKPAWENRKASMRDVFYLLQDLKNTVGTMQRSFTVLGNQIDGVGGMVRLRLAHAQDLIRTAVRANMEVKKLLNQLSRALRASRTEMENTYGDNFGAHEPNFNNGQTWRLALGDVIDPDIFMLSRYVGAVVMHDFDTRQEWNFYRRLSCVHRVRTIGARYPISVRREATRGLADEDISMVREEGQASVEESEDSS